MAYVWVLALHNVLRWVVVVVAIVALVRMYGGLFGNRSWEPADKKWSSWFTITMDIQLVVGLLLYLVLSPITRLAFADMGAAMSNSDLRFFAVEHIMMMVLAVILVHVGSVLARRAKEDRAKFRRGAIWFTLAILLVILSIPWQRPLFPMLG